MILMLPLLLSMQAPAIAAPSHAVQAGEDAMLPCAGGVLHTNVWNMARIGDARNLDNQKVFRDGEEGGWSWDWPESTGPEIKAYPSIIVGQSPWNTIRTEGPLPMPLSKGRLSIFFDLHSEGTGSWNTSFDFWITAKPDPKPADITCNVTIWTTNHGLKPSYKGRTETLKLGGRTYQAILQTPADVPGEKWNTLCLVDSVSRDAGVLDLRPILDFLIQRGFAQPEHLLVTSEIGNETALGKGRCVVRRFKLKAE
jgi:hypothetical protein